MLDTIPRTTLRQDARLLERLHSSREEFYQGARAAGRKFGRTWLESSASYEQLERLWRYRENQREANDGPKRVLGSAEVYLAVHPGTENLHVQAEHFWKNVVGVADDLLRNQEEFLEAFLDAAVADWPRIKEQLEEIREVR
jgi:hypothetical protein